jgi:hypothetical protein
MSEELFPRNENNSILYITRVFKLLFTSDGNNSLEDAVHDLKLLSLLGSIFHSDFTAKSFVYFIKYGAATAWTLQVQLGLSQSRAYASMKTLTALGFIEEIRKFRGMDRVRGGPRPKMWGLTDCSQEQVVEAIQLHAKCKSPKYRQAEEVIQFILDDYVIPLGVTEMTWKQLIVKVREFGKPYRSDDIAQIGIPILKKHGVKVWR